MIYGLILVNKFNVEYFALEEAILLKLFVFSAVKRRKIENKVINPAISPLTQGRDPFQLSVQIVKLNQLENPVTVKNYLLANFGSPAHLTWTLSKVEKVINGLLICQI